MTLHQLRVFATIARARSFARAAESLCLSQPALSEQIKLLESLVGVRLIERSRGRHQIELTEGGRLLLQTCDEVFDALERGVRALERLRGLEGGSVAFGAGMSFGGYMLPRVHDAFQQAYPGINVHLEVNLSTQLLDALKKRKLDLAVIGRPVDDPELVGERLGYYEVVLVGPPGHRLSRVGPVPFAELARERMLLPDPSVGFRAVIDRMAAETGTLLPIVMEVSNVESKLQAVSQGLGIAALPYFSVATGIAAGLLALLQVEGFPIRMEWFIVHPKGELSPAAQVFKEHLLRHRQTLELAVPTGR